MAKVNAPLFGFSARGSLAKSITFGNWRGIPYARQRVTPRNPRSTDQQNQRNAFRMASDAWKAMPGDTQGVWVDFASGQPFTGRNAFIGRNTDAIRSAADLTGLLVSPGTRSAPGLGSILANAGSNPGDLEVTFTPPSLPQGWTLGTAYGLALLNDIPMDVTEWEWLSEEVPGNAGTLTFTGLAPTTDYAVWVYLSVTRPDGVIAFTASRSALGTSG